MYLIEIDDLNRESEAIRHLLSNPLHHERLLAPMGLGKLCWIAMEVDNRYLVPSIFGEVDIIAGPLEFREPEEFQKALERQRAERPEWGPSWHEYLAAKEVAEAGGLLWPPRPAYAVGLEVKCAYFSDRLHSTKDSASHVQGIRKQVNRLQEMGVDRIALLDVIANPPSQGVDTNAWFEAAGRSQDALKEMRAILEARLADDTAAAQFVWSVGAVIGDDESKRGAGSPRMLRPGFVNPDLVTNDPAALANRQLLIEGITKMLGALARPRWFPAIFAGCRACKAIRPFGSECDCARSRLN